MNETKRIIVEFGARRQQFIFTERLILTSKLLNLIGNHFGVKFHNNSMYMLQMYDKTLNEYCSIENDKQAYDLVEDIEQLQRFRVMKKSSQTQKYYLLKNLQSTVEKLHSATRDIDQIQNLVGTLNHSCDILNQFMDTHHPKSPVNQTSLYLLDPSVMNDDDAISNLSVHNDADDENFESVSCHDNGLVYTGHPPRHIPTVINSNKQQLSITDKNVQTRIIPCKYAVRGTCRLGDQCLYLHDEACIRSAKEWERRL